MKNKKNRKVKIDDIARLFEEKVGKAIDLSEEGPIYNIVI